VRATLRTIEDHGSIVCTSCGLEICASTIDRGLNGEARSFAEDDGAEFADSRVGGTFDPLLPVEQQMATYIKAAPGSQSSSIARLCHAGNRQTHTQAGLQAVEVRCRELRLSADATGLARKILHAVLEPLSSACVICSSANGAGDIVTQRRPSAPGSQPPRRAVALHVSLCGHGVCAECEESCKWFVEEKSCKLCSLPMKRRPERLNVPSTHAAVIYLAAKHTPGSGRMVEEVIAGLHPPLKDRQFNEGLKRVKAAAAGNRWLEEALRPALSDLPQLTQLLERRLASLQVGWSTRRAAVAALERHGGCVARHKSIMVVTAAIVLTLQQLCGFDEATALRTTLQVCSGAESTIRTVADKLRTDERFRLGTGTGTVPVPVLSVGSGKGNKRKQDSAFSLEHESPGGVLDVADASASVLEAFDVGMPVPQPQAAAAAAAAADIALPLGWQVYRDETSCKDYYHHAESGVTQWTRPQQQQLQQPGAKRSRRARAPEVVVIDKLLRLFGEHGTGTARYTLTELVGLTDQPRAYLQKILKADGLGEYNKADHTWTLRESY
jgi:hypothetical protein